MKPVLLSIVVVASTLLAGTGAAAPAGKQAAQAREAPLRPVGECMVGRHVRDWGVVDDRRLVVRSLGERYYDVRLSQHCAALDKRPFLSFVENSQNLPLGSGRGFRHGVGQDPVTTDGRICGDMGDAVLPRGGTWIGDDLPCDIAAIRRIDRETFDGVIGRTPQEARHLLDAHPAAAGDVATR